MLILPIKIINFMDCLKKTPVVENQWFVIYDDKLLDWQESPTEDVKSLN